MGWFQDLFKPKEKVNAVPIKQFNAMPFAQKVQAQRNATSDKQSAQAGIISPVPNRQAIVPQMQPIATRTTMMDTIDSIKQIPTKANATYQGLLKGILQVKPSPAPMPTKAPIPKPTPFPRGITRVDPIQPQNIPSNYYTNRNQAIEPKLFDAIMTASPTGDLQLNDYMKRMALALSTQESSGGHILEGDSGKSNGPYHIQRASIPVADRYDPVKSTNLVFQEMLRNMLKNGVPKERSLRTWNYNSGYGNNGPKYNVDIPQMATTSTFYRGN